MRCCMHCSDLLKDLHPVCLLCDMYVCISMHVEGYSVVEVKVYLTSVCYRTGLVFCYSGYLEWCISISLLNYLRSHTSLQPYHRLLL